MKPKLLFIFVEGSDDSRFFEKIFKPIFKKNYDNVIIKEYAQESIQKIIKFINIYQSKGYDYIFTADINDSPCISYKKALIQKKYKIVDPKNIIVIIKEIESWYLAGIDNNLSKIFKIRQIKNTDKITKEKFLEIMSQKRKWFSTIEMKEEILKNYSIEVATQKNKSLKYLCIRYDVFKFSKM